MEIKLYNRDGADLRLISSEDDDHRWTMNVDKDHEYVLKYLRYGMDENEYDIEFIDPAGGPILYIDQILENNERITYIGEEDNDIVIYTSPNEYFENEEYDKN